MADETAFFRFGTNIDEVVTDVQGGLRRLNSALSEPLGSIDLADNAEGMRALFSRVDQDVRQAQERVRTLIADFQNGLIGKGQFTTEFSKVIREGLSSLPTVLAQELGSTRNTVADTSPIRAMAIAMGDDFVSHLVGQVRNTLGDEIGPGFWRRAGFVGDRAEFARNPVDYDSEQIGILNALRNRARAEELIKNRLGKDAVFDPDKSDFLYDDARELGYSRDYMRRLFDEVTERVETDDDDGYRYVPTDTLQRIREIERDRAQFEARGRSIEAQNEREAASVARLAASYMALDAAYDRIGNQLIFPDGRVSRLTPTGLVDEVDPIRIEDAQRRAEAQRIRDLQHRGGVLGGFLGRFHRGDMDFAANFGGQIASAAGFSAAYGSLFAAQAAIRDTINEVKDYQDSLTDLQVATVRADVVTDDWINSLSEMSRLTGENIGVSLDTAARGIRAFGDAAKQSKEEIQAVGSATNEAATMLALIADKPLKDATGDIIAVGTAFGLDPDQLDQITDAVANAKRSLGGDPAQIAQGLSLVANTAQEAGFSLNEAAAVMSLVQARTDQSGQAIATRLSRIFQIISGSTGKRLGAELGVDTNQSIKDQLEDYAELYTTGSAQIQDRIQSALGGTANLRELLPLLQEQPRLQEAYASALTNAGQGTDEFNRKTQNLVGQLKQVAATIKNIQVDLARSGIFAPFGLLLEVINPALQGLNQLIRVYDSLTSKVPALQEILAITAEILLAAKAISAVQAANAVFGFLPGRRGRGADAGIGAIGTELAVELAAQAQGVRLTTAARRAAEQSLNATVVAAAGQRKVAEGLATGGAATGGIRGGLKTMLDFIKRPGFVVGAGLLAGLGAVDYINDLDDQSSGMQDRANTLNTAFSRVDGSSTSLQRAAQDLNAAAGKLAKTDAKFGNQDQQDRDAEFLRDNAAYLRSAAARVAEEERLAAAMRETSVFGDGLIETVGELGKGLQALADSGANARTIAAEFREALMTPPPANGGVYFQPEAATYRTVTNILGALAPAIQRAGANGNRISIFGGPDGDDMDRFGNTLWTPVRPNEAIGAATRLQDQRKIEEAIREEMKQLGLDTGSGAMTPEQEQALIKAGVDAVRTSIFTQEDARKIREEIVDIVTSQGLTAGPGFSVGDLVTGQPFVDKMRELLDPTAEQRNGLLNGRGRLNQDQALALFNTVQDETGAYMGIKDQFAAELANIPSSDDGTMRRQILREQLRFMRRLDRRTEGGLPEVMQDFFRETDRQLRLAVDERLETLRKVAQSAGGLTKKEIRAIGREYLFKRLDNAIQGNDVNLLIDIMEDANQQSLALYRQTLVQAIQVAAAAAQQSQNLILKMMAIAQVAKATMALYAFDRAEAGAVVGVDPNAGVLGGEGAALYDPDKKSEEDKKKEEEQKRKERADRIAAQANAVAARRGGAIAQARADLIGARAQLQAAEKGTTEWFQALASFYQAQESMRNAIADHRYILDQLKGDITDPVENARDALRDARRRLAIDRRTGAGRDVIAADRLAVRENRSALANERFSQRMSDMQTKEELDKITFATYMRYLDAEHDRLSKIKNRTRQQQEQLWEVERAMKDAAGQMDGQFNLGNVNVNGFVYRARRYMAEQRAARDAAQVSATSVMTTNNTVSIQIDGADVAKVRKIIEDYIGTPGRVRAAQPRRRR